MTRVNPTLLSRLKDLDTPTSREAMSTIERFQAHLRLRGKRIKGLQNEIVEIRKEQDDRRISLANEIRETLRVRGFWAPPRPSDLITAVAQALDSVNERHDPLPRREERLVDQHQGGSLSELLGRRNKHE